MAKYDGIPALWVGGWKKPAGVRLKVRSAKATDFFSEVLRRAAKQIAPDELDSLSKHNFRKLVRKVDVDVVVELLLVNWDGVKVDGNSVPFSRASARELMVKDPKFKWLVVGAAGRLDNATLSADVAEGLA